MSTKTGIENLRQSLVENMADFLDNENIKFEQAVNLPDIADDDTRHIRMAEAAIREMLGTPSCPGRPVEKYITNNDRRPDRPGFYRVIYSDGNRGTEYFNGKMWQVQYAHPVDRWLEEAGSTPPALPSPEEWLYENVFTESQKGAFRHGLYPVYSGEQTAKYMRDYAALAARLAREEAGACG